VKTSSRWHGILILAMFLLGVLIVILNYAGLLPVASTTPGWWRRSGPSSSA